MQITMSDFNLESLVFVLEYVFTQPLHSTGEDLTQSQFFKQNKAGLNSEFSSPKPVSIPKFLFYYSFIARVREQIALMPLGKAWI